LIYQYDVSYITQAQNLGMIALHNISLSIFLKCPTLIINTCASKDNMQNENNN